MPHQLSLTANFYTSQHTTDDDDNDDDAANLETKKTAGLRNECGIKEAA
jgi:hypothetical protein